MERLPKYFDFQVDDESSAFEKFEKNENEFNDTTSQELIKTMNQINIFFIFLKFNNYFQI